MSLRHLAPEMTQYPISLIPLLHFLESSTEPVSSVEPLKSGFDGSSASGLGATIGEGSSGLG